MVKLWRVWKIGRLVFVSVPSNFIVAVANQVPGVGYMAAHLKQKNPGYFPNQQKYPHAYSASRVKRSITKHI